MNTPFETARPIVSVSDAMGVLDSGRYSFDEVLDCLHVAKGAEEWDLVDRAAVAALDVIGGRRVDGMRVRDVLYLIVRARLQEIETLEDLPQRLDQLQIQLRNMASQMSRNLGRRLAEVEQELSALVVLVTDGSAASLASACSRLRKLGRPDLAVEAASRSLKLERDNAKALNTRGAAYLDTDNLDAAGDDLNNALRLERSQYVANTLSRYWGRRGSWDEAIRWAREANELDPDGVAGMRSLIKAAAVVGDSELFDQAARALRDRDDDDQLSLFSNSNRWVEYLVARDLFRDGHQAAAEQMVDEILADFEYRPARDLKLEIEAHRHRSEQNPNYPPPASS